MVSMFALCFPSRQLGLRAQLDPDDVAEFAEWNAVGLSGNLLRLHTAESSDVEPAEHVEAPERFHVEEGGMCNTPQPYTVR